MYGPSLLQQTWDELDFYTARIIEDGAKEYDKGYARGLAKVLSLFMVPHFTTPDEIVKEASKRYKMKKAGEDYETPGLGTRIYEPPPGDNKYSTESPEKQKIKAARKVVQPKLDAATIATIRSSAQMFTAKELAEVFNVPESFILEVQSKT